MDNLYLRANKELLEFVKDHEKLSREEFFVKTTKYFQAIIVRLGIDLKLNAKIGLDTTTQPPQTFRLLPGILGG